MEPSPRWSSQHATANRQPHRHLRLEVKQVTETFPSSRILSISCCAYTVDRVAAEPTPTKPDEHSSQHVTLHKSREYEAPSGDRSYDPSSDNFGHGRLHVDPGLDLPPMPSWTDGPLPDASQHSVDPQPSQQTNFAKRCLIGMFALAASAGAIGLLTIGDNSRLDTTGSTGSTEAAADDQYLPAAQPEDLRAPAGDDVASPATEPLVDNGLAARTNGSAGSNEQRQAGSGGSLAVPKAALPSPSNTDPAKAPTTQAASASTPAPPKPTTTVTSQPATSAATTKAPPADTARAGSTWGYYGNPWVPSTLANLEVEGSDRYSYRFLAKSSGPMDGFQHYMQSNTSRTGYAGGNGGHIRYRLAADNGSGFPDESQILAEVTWKPNLNNGSALPPGSDSYTDSHPTYFADKHWPTKPNLVAGNRYHLIIDNIDANSNANYISINSPYAVNGRSRSPFGPSIDNWGLIQDRGSGWSEYTEPYAGTRYEVNLMILMEDNNHYGNSYMDPRKEFPVGSSNKLRQVFAPTTDRHVDQLSVFTSGTGVLRVALVEDGTTIGTWTADVGGEGHSLINTGARTFSAGKTYQLEFSADSGSLSMLTYREGSLGTGYLYPKGGAWDDGYSQYSTGGDWTNTFFDYADVAGVAFRTP